MPAVPTLPDEVENEVVGVGLEVMSELERAVRWGAEPLWREEIRDVDVEGADVVIDVEEDSEVVDGDKMRLSVDELCLLDDIPTSESNVLRRNVDLRIVV